MVCAPETECPDEFRFLCRLPKASLEQYISGILQQRWSEKTLELSILHWTVLGFLVSVCVYMYMYFLTWKNKQVILCLSWSCFLKQVTKASIWFSYTDQLCDVQPCNTVNSAQNCSVWNQSVLAFILSFWICSCKSWEGFRIKLRNSHLMILLLILFICYVLYNLSFCVLFLMHYYILISITASVK